MAAYFGEQIEARRSEPGDDLISHLLSVEIDGDKALALTHKAQQLPEKNAGETPVIADNGEAGGFHCASPLLCSMATAAW